MVRAKAAATAAAFVALVAVAGAAAYVAARDEPPPPIPGTTTTVPTTDEVTAAIAAALSEDLDVPLEDTEARCVADGLLGQLGRARVESLAGGAVGQLSDEERVELVGTVVRCVPPEKAAALLSTTPSTRIGVQEPQAGLHILVPPGVERVAAMAGTYRYRPRSRAAGSVPSGRGPPRGRRRGRLARRAGTPPRGGALPATTCRADPAPGRGRGPQRLVGGARRLGRHDGADGVPCRAHRSGGGQPPPHRCGRGGPGPAAQPRVGGRERGHAGAAERPRARRSGRLG